jgi:hypothetical protein
LRQALAKSRAGARGSGEFGVSHDDDARLDRIEEFLAKGLCGGRQARDDDVRLQTWVRTKACKRLTPWARKKGLVRNCTELLEPQSMSKSLLEPGASK